jgi:hypothetical protein
MTGPLTLSFVTKRRKRAPGVLPLHYWTVQPSGDYEADCVTGDRLALEYLAYDEAEGDFPLLGLIVADMPRETTGVEVGFMSLIGFAARKGAGEARRISTYWAKRAKTPETAE